MLLYRETSPLFTKCPTRTHARTQTAAHIHGHLAATDRKLLALSSACGTSSRQMESSTLTYVGSKLINHLSLSMQDALKPTSIILGERWRGDGWRKVLNLHSERKLLPALISQSFQWDILKMDVWCWAERFLKSFFKCATNTKIYEKTQFALLDVMNSKTENNWRRRSHPLKPVL